MTSMPSAAVRIRVLFLLGVVAACSSSPPPAPAMDASVEDHVDHPDDLGVAPVDRPDVATADLGVDAPRPMDAGVDAAFDAGFDATADVGRDVAADLPPDAPPAVPLTFRDEYLPEFRITIAPADLASMLTMGNDARVPMTLHYMGGSYPGTIRQRLGNNSSCGDLRQFRLDFPSTITFPDGYRSDRFETDRGRCYVLHEWMSVGVMRRVSEMHPELHIAYKYTNVVAIYFNDALYHVETLTEDVNHDLGERLEGTRNVTFYNHGCFEAPTTGFIGTFCRTFDRATLSTMLDIPNYLLWAATTMALAPGDNYPDYPYNWQLMVNETTGIARPLGDDWDEVPALVPLPMEDPFTPSNPTGDLQRHFTALLAEPDLRAQYVRDLQDARAAMSPTVMTPLIAMKYAQVRDLLGRVPGLPFTQSHYDDIYGASGYIPAYFQTRYDFLGRVIANADGGM